MEDDTCWDCNIKMKRKEVPYYLYGTKIGDFPAIVCEKCNQTYFDEETSKKITEIGKEKGLWGLAVRSKIGVSGTSLDIRLPKKISEYLNLSKGKDITIYPESKDKLIISL